MGATRLSLADDFGLELELAPDCVLVRVDNVTNEVAAANRKRSRALAAKLKEAEAKNKEPKAKESDEDAEARVVAADVLYDEARDIMLEVVASQTLLDGEAPSLDELRRRLPTLPHAVWANNGLNQDVELDPTKRNPRS